MRHIEIGLTTAKADYRVELIEFDTDDRDLAGEALTATIVAAETLGTVSAEPSDLGEMDDEDVAVYNDDAVLEAQATLESFLMFAGLEDVAEALEEPFARFISDEEPGVIDFDHLYFALDDKVKTYPLGG